MTAPARSVFAEPLAQAREAWTARCHFCHGPCFPWQTDDETWAKVEPLLGQHQACFECFGAAWFSLGLNDGEPFAIRTSAARDLIEQRATEMETALERIQEQQPKTLDWLRANGIIFDGPLGTDPGNWEHVAFSIYSDLCETDSIARAALSAREPHPEDTPADSGDCDCGGACPECGTRAHP